MLEDNEIPVDEQVGQNIANNLRTRHQSGECFTLLGNRSLISTWTEKIDDMLNENKAKDAIQGNTHNHNGFYKFFEKIIKQCANFGRRSCVLFLGEPGSGKSRLCFEAMNFASCALRDIDDVFRFRLVLLRANTILNTLGTTKFHDGRNSSHFVNCIQLFYKSADPTSLGKSMMQSYLLDTDPLRIPLPDMDGFAIFYVLLFGKTELQLEQVFGLSSVLRQFSAAGSKVDKTLFRNEYRKFLVAAQTHSFSDGELHALWSVIAAVAHLLGNYSEEDDTKWWIASLLGIEDRKLQKMLSRYKELVGQEYRLLFAKVLYKRLFEWVSIKINKAFGDVSEMSNVSPASVTLIDIPGRLADNRRCGVCRLAMDVLEEKIRLKYIERRIDDVYQILGMEIPRFLTVGAKKANSTDLGLSNEVQTLESHIITLEKELEVLLTSSSTAEWIKEIWEDSRARKSDEYGSPEKYARCAMNEIFKTLDRTEDIHAVYCLKNLSLCPDAIREFVMLKQTSVYDLCTYKQFVQRYGIIESVNGLVAKRGDLEAQAKAIAHALTISQHCYFKQDHILFTSPEVMPLLESLRAESFLPQIRILQKAVSTWFCRRKFIMGRAATVIARFYRTMSVHRYFEALFDLNMTSLYQASTLSPPKIPATIRCQKPRLAFIFFRWYSVVKKEELRDDLRELIRAKYLATKLLRKRPSFISTGFLQLWYGDYLSKAPFNSNFAAFSQKINDLRIADQFDKVLFSTLATKMNSRGSTDYRAIVVTDKYLYKLDPSKSYAVKKLPISVTDFTGISVTNGNDQLVALHRGCHDLVFIMRCENDRVGELVAVMAAVYERNKKRLVVKIHPTISAHFEKETYTINVAYGNNLSFRRVKDVVLVTTPLCKWED